MPARRKPTAFIDCLNRPSRGWIDDIRLALAQEVVNGARIDELCEEMDLGPNTLSRFVQGNPTTSLTLDKIVYHLALTVRVSR